MRTIDSILLAALPLALTGCTPDAIGFSSGSVEGSLRAFLVDPLVCACGLDLRASDWRVQYACDGKEDVGYYLTFYTPLPASANVRGVAATTVQADAPSWPSTGFGGGAAMMEFGSEDFGNPGLSEAQQVSQYREVFIWELDVPAQRICSELDPSACLDLEAGHATDVRFTCGVQYR